MADGNPFNIPLSPPTSPRISQYHTESADNSWQDHKVQPLEATPDSATGEMALVRPSMPGLDLDANRKPLLRSSKSFPYPLLTSGTNIHEPDTPPLNSSDGSPTSINPDGLGISNLDTSHHQDMAIITFGGSAPASPMSNMSADSPNKDGHDQQDLNGLNIDMDDLTEEREDNSKPMTAAEIRAQKRKMKRFRLTHNQTRFLMSEFARQAHPDAAHRERLAREIPGLSPRQVQVWFQNRRAKLKRLTSDDRERMMRSRALPDDFDMTQALHSPFGASHGVGNNLNSPSNYNPSFPEGNMIRPLNMDTLRRIPDNSHMSPSGITPAFGGFNFTPPQSVTDTLSPVSPAGDGGPFSYSPTLDNGSRRSNPFANTHSPSAFTSHPQIPRLQLHDKNFNRSRSETISSPLRTSMSYGGPEGRDNMSQSMHNSPTIDSNGQNNGMLPYGLGYSYSNTGIPGFQATSNSRMRSFSNGIPPRRIELGQNNGYQPNRNAPTPQTASFPHYTSSPMAAPNNYSMLSAPHHVNSFPSSYSMRQDGSPTEPFPSVDSLIGDNDSNHNGDNNENNDGSIQSLSNF
ncbi:hypothetical protein EJ08DRAFT_404617 [Tothia fuscella]|uniref:Homeobox domain-containing protein n=1 Tax=Tothia fuscella TaxID=1048955 RepID=A0A9P4NKX9_9PEZI|nr:hypothetical protein EJ08DRAFT_404617 [Tothia fuscella]